MGRLKKSKFVK